MQRKRHSHAFAGAYARHFPRIAKAGFFMVAKNSNRLFQVALLCLSGLPTLRPAIQTQLTKSK
jgi:hypothetical protein